MLRPSAVIAALAALASLLGFCAQLAIAHAFGAGAALDAWLIAGSVPLALSGLLAAMLSYAFVPILAAARDEGNGLARLLISRQVRATALAVVAGIVLSMPLIAWLGAPLGPAWWEEMRWLSALAWLAAGFAVLSAALGCVLTAHQRFYAPFAAGVLPYAGILGAVLLLATEYGVVSVAVGLLGGTVAGTCLLWWRSREWLRVPAPGPAPEAGQQARRAWLALPAAAAALCGFTVYPMIDAYWAPRLGTGSLAHLAYAQRIVIAAGNLVVVGPAALLVARMLAVTAAARDPREQLLHSMRWTLLAATALAALLWLAAGPLVALLLERGSFTAADTADVSRILRPMAVGMVAMTGCVLLVRGLFQLHRAGLAAALGLTWTLLYALMSGPLSAAWGVEGIAVAYAGAWWVVLLGGSAALLQHPLRRRVQPAPAERTYG